VVVPDGAASGAVRIELDGRITAYTAEPVWRAALDTLRRNPGRPVIVDASRLVYADTVGVAMLFDLLRQRRPVGAEVQFLHLPDNLATLIHAYDPQAFQGPALRPPRPGMLAHVGQATLELLDYFKRLSRFVADCMGGLGRILIAPRSGRWHDVLDIATEAGANGVPVVLLIGFLIGVIIAFESALVARGFGAVIYVVSGVAFAILRELGPLMTAIIFAGRTGAAFAAQLGIQKVNEEVNAITTFGLSPVQFLVLPRITASLLAMPLLTVLSDLAGLFGAALVLTGFDISYLQFYNQLLHAVTPWDFVLGLIKGLVFGLTIAIVGCHRGLTTGAGASSVGLSTTAAVVTSIVLVIVIDGIFSLFTA
jgi:phospholipid/cholesterol/gamma-HCH transport system permease protein